MKHLVVSVLTGIGVLLSSAAQSWDLEDLEQSFYPYKDGVPSLTGYSPGVVIDKSNVEQFKDALDPGMYAHVTDGWTTMQTAPTRDFPLSEKYIEATRQMVNDQPTVVEGQQVSDNYTAGRAFPHDPDANDPQAGVKMAWNYLWGYNWGDNACICPFYWDLRNAATGDVERSFKWNFMLFNWMHRTHYEPIPEVEVNPAKLFRSLVGINSEPFDLRNTQILINRYEDDRKRTDAWLYLGFQRRVRRLATGQITDAFLGTDLMIEDFEGYEGRIFDYDWKFIETKNMFLPFHYHDELPLAAAREETDGFRYVDYNGQGNCFPVTTWELRKVHVIDGSPQETTHPLTKRRMYIDSQTATIPRSLVYDKEGDLWKSFTICQAHSDHYAPVTSTIGSGVPIDDCFMVLDIQAMHCTTGQFKAGTDPAQVPIAEMTVQAMRKRGR